MKKQVAIIVGGTGLYFQSLINCLVKIPNIPVKLRNKIRKIQKKYVQEKFYKKLFFSFFPFLFQLPVTLIVQSS